MTEGEDPMASIEARNEEVRARFIRTFEMLDVTQNCSLAQWEAEGRIFSVLYQGRDLYPAFQLDNEQPLGVIAEILPVLPAAMSAWERAFWFVSANGWLEGASPCECLTDEERVIGAAKREGEAVID